MRDVCLISCHAHHVSSYHPTQYSYIIKRAFLDTKYYFIYITLIYRWVCFLLARLLSCHKASFLLRHLSCDATIYTVPRHTTHPVWPPQNTVAPSTLYSICMYSKLYLDHTIKLYRHIGTYIIPQPNYYIYSCVNINIFLFK